VKVQGKIAVVIGGARGIARAIASSLAAAEADYIVARMRKVDGATGWS
jgi:NAD(P)-dependent dehydrogenase (short-subunit alcohol dehydrogenase family)